MRNPALCIAALLFAALTLMPGVAHAVDAEPNSLLINTLDSVTVIRLSNAGKPLAASDIRGAKFMINDSNYSRMIDAKPVDGGIRLAPTDSLEVGSYTLVIETKYGAAILPVEVPLKGESGVLEERTEALGGAKDEAMRDIGLATELPRGNVQFSLPPRFVVGQTLKLAAPAAPGVLYRWRVNGEIVGEGGGEQQLAYVFPAEGDYTVTLEQGGGRSEWTEVSKATTMAEESNPVEINAKQGQRVTFSAPEGYGKYTWNLDGKFIAQKRTVGLNFPNPGKYMLVCRCEESAGGDSGAFYNVRYEVTVP